MQLSNSKLGKRHIVCIARTFGFPNGMAATQRLRLMARALVEQGINVTVLIMWVSERPPQIENTQVKGKWNGVHFEYTTGTTIRSPHFLVRRWVELLGIVRALVRVIQLRRNRDIDYLYLYDAAMHMTIAHWLFLLLARLSKIPVAIELNERPWSLKKNASVFERRISPLLGVKGVIVISDWLKNWIEAESNQYKLKVAVLQLPILVDVNELMPRETPSEIPNVMYAASPGYDDYLNFILDAMQEVWREFPACRLVVTGNRQVQHAYPDTADMVGKCAMSTGVDYVGYLPRQELLDRYTSAWALLIPLFDDIRSKARFPTKIGEYLASGRPVVTNRIGEVSRYFEDQVNAFVCEPGNARLYGQAILRAIQDPVRGRQIGCVGRLVAERNFHYLVYASALARFFESLA